jgi:hypothetical protein
MSIRLGSYIQIPQPPKFTLVRDFNPPHDRWLRDDRTSDARKRAIGVGANQSYRSDNQHQNNCQHYSVFCNVLAAFFAPKCSNHVSHSLLPGMSFLRHMMDGSCCPCQCQGHFLVSKAYHSRAFFVMRAAFELLRAAFESLRWKVNEPDQPRSGRRSRGRGPEEVLNRGWTPGRWRVQFPVRRGWARPQCPPALLACT